MLKNLLLSGLAVLFILQGICSGKEYEVVAVTTFDTRRVWDEPFIDKIVPEFKQGAALGYLYVMYGVTSHLKILAGISALHEHYNHILQENLDWRPAPEYRVFGFHPLDLARTIGYALGLYFPILIPLGIWGAFCAIRKYCKKSAQKPEAETQAK